MARKYKNMNEREVENYEAVIYRVMFRDSNNKINERKFKSEEEAKEFYYSVDDKNKTKQLDLIKNCRFTSLLFERLGGYNKWKLNMI